MRKSLASRITVLALIYCIVFVLLVIIQFSNKGSFSLTVGQMTIRGRYADTAYTITEASFYPIDLIDLTEASDISNAETHDAAVETDNPDDNFRHINENEEAAVYVTGGIRIYFGGLEFSLNEVHGKGLTLIESGRQTPVNPVTMTTSGTKAHFGLPGGTIITFNSISTEIGQELIVTAEFAGDVSEIIIPITPRRSSIVREENQLGIMYSGTRYLFAQGGHELEENRIILTRENSMVSYRSRTRQSEFDPSAFIIAQANNYESFYLNWREESYLRWNQQPSALQNELDIMAYCTEALSRRNYPSAQGAISREFINSTRHSFRSAAFIGSMTSAYRTFTAAETAKMNTISSLVRERSLEIFNEYHIIDYLFTRSNTALTYNIVDLIDNLTPEMITIELCAGLLETALDLKRWRPAANNPIEPLLDYIFKVISENLIRDSVNDYVYVSGSEGILTGEAGQEFNLRLGKALMEWAEITQDSDWLAIGRSLVISSLTEAGPGAGNLYSIINQEANYPKAVWLMDNGLWAWTAASGVRASDINGDINITFNFPVNMTHYVMIRGVRPFTRIQIHDTDWRTDTQFERYDSSGWVYYQQEQVLVLKLKHRQTTENVRIIYRAPAPVRTPPPPAQTAAPEQSDGESAD